MEAKRSKNAGRQLRYGYARIKVLSLPALLIAALVVSPLFSWNPLPVFAQGTWPPPAQIDIGQGTATASNQIPGTGQGGSQPKSGGGSGGSSGGNPGGKGGGGDGGGPGYFNIVLPGGTDTNGNNTFDASYVSSCADQGTSTVSYQSGGSNIPSGGGGGGGGAGGNSGTGADTHPGGSGGAGGGHGHSALPRRTAMYAALEGKYAYAPAPMSGPRHDQTPKPPAPPAFPTAQKAPWLDPTPVPQLVNQGGGPGANAAPTPGSAYGPVVGGGPTPGGDPQPPVSNVVVQPVGAPWWMTPQNGNTASSGGSATSPSVDSCAGGNSSRLMRNALFVSGGGGGRRMGGKIILSCTANLSGAVSAAVLTGLASFGYNVSGLIPFTSCFPVSPTDNTPCPPILGAGLTMNCPGDVRSGWSFGGASVIVSISIPPVRVVRSPFPRGIVTIPNTLVVDGAPTANGPNWSNLIHFPAQGYLQGGGDWSTCSLDAHPHAPPCGGDIRNYELGLKMDRLAPDSDYPLGHVDKSCWTWGDWQNKDANPCGLAGHHTYETSSNTDVNGMGGKIDANGPRVDLAAQNVPSWDLQSYEAGVPTFWSPSFDVKYKQANVTFNTSVNPSPGVTCTGGSPPPDFVGPWVSCNANGQPGWEPGTLIYIPVVTWVPYEQGWKTIDLTKYGNAKWFFTSYRQYECGLYAGREWCQQAPPPGQAGGLPVPIVKENPVLVEPCADLGVCS